MSSRPCSVDGCTTLARDVGMCPSHYNRSRRYGDPLYEPRRDPLRHGPSLGPRTVVRVCGHCSDPFYVLPKRPNRFCSPACARASRMAARRAGFADRFWAQVQKTESCWVWTGRQHNCGHGYGAIKNLDTSEAMTHRVSWELTDGPIPNGLCVLHRCDNPPCVRPSHLFLGTQQDNVADKVSKGRQHRGVGHPMAKLSAQNITDILARHRRSNRWNPSGASLLDLAREFGVSRETIGRIVRKESYQDVC